MTMLCLNNTTIDLMREPLVVLTADTDWAPEPCVRDLLGLIESRNVPTTVFATHDVKPDILQKYDIGIHPNFQGPAQDTESIRGELQKLVDIFPSATGERSHALLWSSRHFNLLCEQFPKLRYTSNYMMFRQPHIQPFVTQANTVELPIFWVDDLCVHLDDEIYVSSNLRSIEQPGLKVFAFHPFHVYANSRSRQHVQQAREFYHAPERLLSLRRSGNGARTMLESLLKKIHKLGIPAVTCDDLATAMLPAIPTQPSASAERALA